MGQDIAHALGSPIWFELATSDVAKAKAFYAALMGWSHQEFPMGDGSLYTTLESDGAEVAGTYPLMPEQAAQGVPSHWDIYFHVEDVDAAVDRARELGGKVFVEPMEVKGHLRMAVLGDSEGAMFCLMQPHGGTGVGKLREDHSVTWVELATRDLDAACRFYAGVLGWKFADHPSAPVAYKLIGTGDGNVGGMMQMTAEWGDLPSHWSIYLQTPDIHASVDTAKANGATINVPAFEAPGVGQIAQLSDPTGAWFYLIQLSIKRMGMAQDG